MGFGFRVVFIGLDETIQLRSNPMHYLLSFLKFCFSYPAQIRWIRKHPVLYVVLNVVATAGFLGFIELSDRYLERDFETDINEQHRHPPYD